MEALYKNFFRQKKKVDPVIKALEKVPIFEHLSEKELKNIVQLTHEREYKADEYIFKKHAPAEGMYVILNGKIEIKDPESGSIFASLNSGDFFGELALLDEEPRSASAVCNEPSRLIGFFRSDLLTVIKRYPKLGNKILLNLSRVLGERLRETNKNIIRSK